jgi:hypothetical protein
VDQVSIFNHVALSLRIWKIPPFSPDVDVSNFVPENKDSRGDRDGFRGLWRRIKPVDKPDIVRPLLFSLSAV